MKPNFLFSILIASVLAIALEIPAHGASKTTKKKPAATPAPATAAPTEPVCPTGEQYEMVRYLMDGKKKLEGFEWATRPVNLNHVKAIYSSGIAGCIAALKDDGTVVVWGNENNASYKVCAKIPADLSGVIAIATASEYVLAVKRDGTIAAWGIDNDGVITIPAGLDKVIAVAAGMTHAVALKADGSVVAWGDEKFTKVPEGLSNVTAISTGFDSTLALKRDGTVIGWGGTKVPEGLKGVTAISAGVNVNVALKDDGTVAIWNNSGKLKVPAGLNEVKAVYAGVSAVLALRRNGTAVLIYEFGSESSDWSPPAEIVPVEGFADAQAVCMFGVDRVFAIMPTTPASPAKAK